MMPPTHLRGKSLIIFHAILYAGLLNLSSATDGADDRVDEEEYQALVQAFENGRREYVAAFRKAKTEAESARAIAEKRPDEKRFIAGFLAIAERDPASPIAAKAANWILTHTPFDPDPKAVEIIASHHVTSDAIGPLCQAIGFSTTQENGVLLRRILERNPHRQVRAAACIGLSQHLLFVGNRPSRTAKESGSKRAIAMQTEAEMFLNRAIAEYGDVQQDGRLIADTAREILADIHTHGIGVTAPETEGRDADGKRFKLSDFKGRVVLLTFAGIWCGPCKVMYPEERELVERMDGEAFTMLSVSTDAHVETLRASIQSREITWRCWWDGGTGGPICNVWNVQRFPTIYVLDAQGVIRYPDTRGPDLRTAVDVLISEITK
ncbi:Peroxiredoxin [Singulisphaera sp. GP187]|uniref:TlpA family protein disulfide reductase n=1 Tax=Singulisphaera sp. GP187 TaxID=1882752 RepID=UPI000925EFDB|nr:TlpA disulfide reductase family protein [Singulisphaera sp. GP187]SIO28256.1 Peroxiredoxin [Singulisphaera sp. GP187]